MPRLLSLALWPLCGLLLVALAFRAGAEPWVAGPFRIDALALFLGAAATLVSAVVHGFALRHMAGEARFDLFFARLTGLTAIVLALLAADSVLLFAGLWVAMGWLLADAIGHVRDWPQARAASAFARVWFLRGSAALVVGLALLSVATGSLSIAGIAAGAAGANGLVVALGCAALGVAAAIQCGLFPFHRWLMGSMTAPTPVSAFMHAGLVNAGGILVARFAPAFEAAPTIMLLLFAAGAASALFGQLAAMVQPDVKRGLGASTSAQMGFMLMQCGLGFHAAAMAHLVLHGLYKASLFLGAGSGLAIAPRPAAPRLVDLGPALVAAILGGAGFAIVTGKFFNDTGAILVLFAAMAAAQASLAAPATGAMRWAGVPAALGVAGVLYGLLVLAIEALLSGMPGLTAPQDFTTLHLIIVDLFVIAWLAVLAGLHRRSAALYVRVLGLSQPAASAVTDRREAYHA